MKRFYTMTLSAIVGAMCVTGISAQVPVSSVEILVSGKPATEGKLAVGGVRTFTVNILPADATDKAVKWSTSDEGIATLNTGTAGKIRGMKGGTAVITAEVAGVKATYTVAVTQKDAKPGDYYYDNNSWETGGIVNGKKIVGVVFYVNPDDKQSGKIVSLDEAKQLKWSLAAAPQPGANSDLDGMANLAAIKKVTDWTTKYDAEAWCNAKTDADLTWYLPAVDELRQLFAASCSKVWVASGATAANEVNNWTENSATMVPNETNPFPTERAAFNALFTKVGATALNADGTTKYWSSTQYADDFAKFLSFEGGFSNSQPRQYFHVCNVRAIAQFPIKDITTSIDELCADTPAAIKGIYTLQGVRLDTDPANLAPGLYIIDGKKVAVK